MPAEIALLISMRWRSQSGILNKHISASFSRSDEKHGLCLSGLADN